MRQREPRRKVLVKARMRTAGEWGDVLIHNMSSRGLLAATDMPCRPGTVIEIRRVHHVVIGRVVWANDQYFGIRTQDRIDIEGIVQAKPPAYRPGEEPREAARAAADRRSAARPVTQADLADRAARSRSIASILQFVILGGAAVAASLLIAQQVGSLLSRPLATIGAHLAPGEATTDPLRKIPLHR